MITYECVYCLFNHFNSISNIPHRTVGWLTNSEGFGNILSQNLSGGTEENHETSVSTAGDSDKIWIKYPQIQYTVTVSVSVQQYILYHSSTPSLHVSALLGHLQVMITVLDCHTVRCIYINIYFFILTHVMIVYIKVFRSFLKMLLKSHKFFFSLSLKLIKNWPFIGCRPTLYMRVLCALQLFSCYVLCCFMLTCPCWSCSLVLHVVVLMWQYIVCNIVQQDA
jgi:hypothetical protein